MQLLYRLAASAVLASALLIVPLESRAQTATVSGTVVDAAGAAPMPGVNVGIEGTVFGAATDAGGSFTIENIPPGRYVIVASSVGYEPSRRTVQLSAGETATIRFTLRMTDVELQEVEVVGRRETTYDASYSFAATKTATPITDVPQSISVVTKEVIDDQQIYTLNETTRNVSGVNTFSGYNDLVTRGFRNQNTRLINGLKTEFGFWSSPILPHIERVEFIKGPASALFAAANPGGTVNLVTKKPLATPRQAVSFGAGSFSQYRFQSDLTGPLNSDGTLLYRLNVGYEDTESFRFLQGHSSMLVAPSVSFLPSDRTRVNADLVYARRNGTLDRGQAIFFGSTDLTSTPISFSLSQPGDYMVIDDLHLTLSVEHELTDRLSLNASYLKYNYDEDLSEHRTSNRFLPDDPTVLQLAYIRRIQDRSVDNISTYLVADAETGRLEHQTLAGFDFFQQDDNRSQWGARGDEFLVLSDGSTRPGGGVANFDLDDPLYTLNRDPETYTANWFSQPRLVDPNRTRSYGAYVQDQVTFGPAHLLVGLRHEWYRTRQPDMTWVEQTALIPRVGLVYEVTGDVNVYGTFTQGFEPQSASIIASPDIYGGPFDPETSDLLETGAKGSFLNGRLLATTAIYQITKRNVLVNANAPGNPELLEQRGETRSRGFEIELVGSVSDALRITGNYAFNDAVITESDDPAEIGLVAENAPAHQGGLWSRYTVTSGPLAGVGFGAGVRFVTERETFDRSLTLPDHAILDASIFYAIGQFRITGYADNLLDDTHWVGGYNYGRIFPGTPRNIRVKIGYSF